jgi:hypothetical protein
MAARGHPACPGRGSTVLAVALAAALLVGSRAHLFGQLRSDFRRSVGIQALWRPECLYAWKLEKLLRDASKPSLPRPRAVVAGLGAQVSSAMD